MPNLALNLNQFTMTEVLGALTQDPQPATIVCQINPAGTGVYVPGQPVKLLTYANAGGQIVIDVCASNADGPVFGVLCYSKQKNQFAVGDQVNVACRGNIIFLESSAAIVRGTQVSATPTGALGTDPTVATDTTNGHYIVGAALGQAAAANALIRIMISPGIQSASGLQLTAP